MRALIREGGDALAHAHQADRTSLQAHTHHARVGNIRKRGEVEERVSVPVPASEPGHDYANVAEWFRAIREGVPNYPNLEDGILAVMPVFAAETASKEKREVGT